MRKLIYHSFLLSFLLCISAPITWAQNTRYDTNAGYANRVYSPSDREFKQTPQDSTARRLPKGSQNGLIAQEVLPELVVADEEGYLSVNYTRMIPVLVEAIKALQTGQDTLVSLQQQIRALQQENVAIKKQLSAMQSLLNTGSESPSQVHDKGLLLQNIPNPPQQTTTITYQIPASARQAYLVIRNLLGEEIMRVDHLTAGQGSAEISTSGLTSGTYIYSLVVDGKVVDSKKMVVK